MPELGEIATCSGCRRDGHVAATIRAQTVYGVETFSLCQPCWLAYKWNTRPLLPMQRTDHEPNTLLRRREEDHTA